MARKFRYYEKKRGNRRTGSRTFGIAGEVLFFAAFLLLGCGGLVALFALWVIPEWCVNHEFVETTCTVLGKELGKSEDDDGTYYRVEIRIAYRAKGKDYVTTTYDVHRRYSSGSDKMQAILDRFVVDSENPREYPCWYNPADPQQAVLVRGYNWWLWLVFLVPASFIAIGTGGLIYRVLHWGKSAERRSAMVQRAAERDPFNSNGKHEREFPNIPSGADITNSPGTRLKFRLPIGASAGWALFGTMLACLVWNGIVAAFAVPAVRGHLRGDPEWVLTLFVVLFGLGGIVLLVFFVRQFLITTGIGPTLVEISEHPLHPGQQCRLFLSQSGRLAINSVDVLLVCEEEATYRQGTNTRTETRKVCQQQLFHRDAFEVHRGMPFEAECELSVPAEAMHSFKAAHNGVHWKVVVKGHVARWPDYERSFPVIIHPANGSNHG